MARRSKIQKVRDYVTIAEQYLAGVEQVEIADFVGISQQMVSKELKVLQERWLERSVVDFDDRQGNTGAELDFVDNDRRLIDQGF